MSNSCTIFGENESYRNEDSEVLKSYLERTYFSRMRGENESPYNSLELYFGDLCDLQCKYCYLSKYGKEYFEGTEPRNHKQVLKNAKLIIDFAIDNKLSPSIELFGGEALSLKVGHDTLEYILEKVKEGFRPENIVIPTNFNFLFNTKKTSRIENLYKKFKKYNVDLLLSASIDGKYMEENRPFINSSRKRDDKFYDDLFSFAKEHHCGFHPMIYSERIEKWTDNFLWFQEMFEKYNIPFDCLYLLEVRNYDWSEKQCLEYAKFLKFLIKWTYNRFAKNNENFWKFCSDGGFNIFGWGVVRVGRGTLCSNQSTLCVKVPNLSIVPCHRMAYPYMEAGSFIEKDGKIIDIQAKNLELYLATQTADHTTFPYCERCLLNDMCAGGCMGCQYEITGDVFTPIPTVCRLFHIKALQFMNTYKEIGFWDCYINRIDQTRKNIFQHLEEVCNQ